MNMTPEQLPEKPRDIAPLPREQKNAAPSRGTEHEGRHGFERTANVEIERFLNGKRAPKDKVQFRYEFIGPEHPDFDDNIAFIKGGNEHPGNPLINKSGVEKIMVIEFKGGQSAVAAVDRLGKLIGYAD